MAERICPFWRGYLLSNPIRKLVNHPQKILRPHIKEGMKVIDIGCAMGFFSLPIAKMIGSEGKVICIDIQERMIKSLIKRAKKVDLLDRIETRLSTASSFCLDDLDEEIDFALAFYVVHEVSEPKVLFEQLYKVLKSQARLLMAEPKGHVSITQFTETIQEAQEQGFKVIDMPNIYFSHTVLLEK